MTKKRHKLRLRKQVIICVPIVLLIIGLAVGISLFSKESYATEIAEKQIVTASNDVDDTILLSETEFIKSIDRTIKFRQKDNTVIYYATKFKLNVNKALEIVHKYTNNYTDKNFLETNMIAKPALAKNIDHFDSFEAGVVFFIRDLHRYPEKYGSSIEEMRVDSTATINDNVVKGIVYMDNGMTFEQYVGKICDLFGVDKNLALAISYHEAGVKTSTIFKNKNNIGGLKGYYGWMSFTTLEAGVISHVLSLKNLIDSYEIDTNSPDAIAQLSGIYVKGRFGTVSEHWIEKVTYYKNDIESKDLFTIE